MQDKKHALPERLLSQIGVSERRIWRNVRAFKELARGAELQPQKSVWFASQSSRDAFMGVLRGSLTHDQEALVRSLAGRSSAFTRGELLASMGDADAEGWYRNRNRQLLPTIVALQSLKILKSVKNPDFSKSGSQNFRKTMLKVNKIRLQRFFPDIGSFAQTTGSLHRRNSGMETKRLGRGEAIEAAKEILKQELNVEEDRELWLALKPRHIKQLSRGDFVRYGCRIASATINRIKRRIASLAAEEKAKLLLERELVAQKR